MPRVDLAPKLARDAAPGPKDTILFDRALPGFGLRIHPTGRKVWIVQARIEGRSRRIVIARHGEMDLAEARRRAHDMFARILPAFGRMPLDRIGPEDMAAWFDAASRDRPGAANRAFEILRAMMFRAEEWGLRERDTNPCLGIAKNPRKQVARFLKADELARLGGALDAHEARWPEAVAAVRLLALTGCRRSEVLDLRWRNVADGALKLEDSKTGPRTVPLDEAARALIAALPGPRDPDAYLFPKNAERRSAQNIVDCWRAVCEDARLGRLRLHDLRHTAASQAVMAGETLPLVGKLLGHRRHRTTSGYAHLADGHLVETAEKVGSIIAEAMKLHIAPPSRPHPRRSYGRWV